MLQVTLASLRVDHRAPTATTLPGDLFLSNVAVQSCLLEALAKLLTNFSCRNPDSGHFSSPKEAIAHIMCSILTTRSTGDKCNSMHLKGKNSISVRIITHKEGFHPAQYY